MIFIILIVIIGIIIIVSAKKIEERHEYLEDITCGGLITEEQFNEASAEIEAELHDKFLMDVYIKENMDNGKLRIQTYDMKSFIKERVNV